MAQHVLAYILIVFSVLPSIVGGTRVALYGMSEAQLVADSAATVGVNRSQSGDKMKQPTQKACDKELHVTWKAKHLKARADFQKSSRGLEDRNDKWIKVLKGRDGNTFKFSAKQWTWPTWVAIKQIEVPEDLQIKSQLTPNKRGYRDYGHNSCVKAYVASCEEANMIVYTLCSGPDHHYFVNSSNRFDHVKRDLLEALDHERFSDSRHVTEPQIVEEDARQLDGFLSSLTTRGTDLHEDERAIIVFDNTQTLPPPDLQESEEFPIKGSDGSYTNTKVKVRVEWEIVDVKSSAGKNA